MKTLLIFLSLFSLSFGQLNKPSFKGINNDPNVIYVEDISEDIITFKVAHERPVYLSKNGNRAIGRLKVGSLCQLIGFDDRAFYIKGEAIHSNVTGWVTPYALEKVDEEFVSDIKKVYDRELLIRELIAQKEVAFGMTPNEVELILGEPTKTKIRRTAKGSNGTYEYLETSEQKHYTNSIDPISGQIFRIFSHTTTEISKRILIEFTDNAVSAIENEKDNSTKRRKTKIVTSPIYIDWAIFH